jgi:hypothetical protein
LNEFELSSWNIKRSVAGALRTFFRDFLERAQENHRAGVEDRCTLAAEALYARVRRTSIDACKAGKSRNSSAPTRGDTNQTVAAGEREIDHG